MRNISVKICDKCRVPSRVVDSRVVGNMNVCRRRRCPKCGKWWETVEMVK